MMTTLKLEKICLGGSAADAETLILIIGEVVIIVGKLSLKS